MTPSLVPPAPPPPRAPPAPPRPWSHLLLPGVCTVLAAGVLPMLQGLPWRLAATLTWCIAVWLVVRVVDLTLWERLLPRTAGLRVPQLLRQLAGLMIGTLAATLLLSQVWGLAIGPMLAATGAIGIVLGLALRNVLADFFSGIALNLEQPFRLDDFVLVHVRGKREPVAGFVREINWRSTTVLTPEDNLISVPNSVVAASTVENLSFPSPVSELELDIQLHWQLGVETVERLLGAAMVDAWARGATSGDRPPKCRLARLDGGGMTWRIVYLIDPRRQPKGPARHLLLTCVHRHLRMAGLQPVPAELAGREAPPQRPRQAGLAADRAGMLALAPLLDVLTDDERSRLAAGVQVHDVPAQAEVVRAGEPGGTLFVLVAGALEVVRGVPPGRVNVLSPGDTFGEMSLLTGAPRSAAVVALCPSVLFEITREPLMPLLQARPELARALAEQAAIHQQRDAATGERPAAPPGAPRARLTDTILEAMRRLFRPS